MVIRIRAGRDALHVAVDDDGGSPDTDAGGAETAGPGHTGRAMRAGTGLANLRARLACLHGSAFELALVPNAHGGCTARVLVPIAHVPFAEAA